MPTLGSPLPLPCGQTLANRLAKSAMSENMADSGHIPGERLCRVYQRWGASGAGLLISGNVMVDARALGEPYNVVIEQGVPLEPLQRWARAGQALGTPFWLQLNHPGRQSPRSLVRQPVAPSAVPLDLSERFFAPPRALEPAEIPEIIGRFATAASITKKAGFAGVQVHGAHGYLVSQFLSPLSNRREDAWGGDAPRRRRFLLEIVRAIRAEVGPGFPIGVKLNSADFQRGGFSEEESMEVVSALEAEGIDLLEISGGTYERPAMSGAGRELKASTIAREAYFLNYARQVRARTRLPLMLTGGFRTRAGMEAAVSEGVVDVVGLARPLALEPDLPRGLLDGTVLDSRVEPRRTGLRAVDGLVEIAWYTAQIHRLGLGRDPDPGLWPWRVLAGLAWDNLFGA